MPANSEKRIPRIFPVPSTAEFIAGGLGGVGQVLAANAFKGPLDCLVKTVQTEGLLGLYKGMGAPIAGVALVNAVLFSAYGWAKDCFPGRKEDLKLYQIAFAGSFAGFVNSFFASPIELLKIRLQAQRSLAASAYYGPTDVIRKIIREQGISSGLFRGLFVTICKEIPAYAGFYAGFEFMKRYQMKGDTPLSIPQLMFAGSVGGMSYWCCCYPLDIIKTRIQQNSSISTSILVNAHTMIKQEGVSSFFKGFGVSLVRSVPSAAATFTVYELCLAALQN